MFAKLLFFSKKCVFEEGFCVFFFFDADVSEKCVFGFVAGEKHDAGGGNAGEIHVGCSGSAGGVGGYEFVFGDSLPDDFFADGSFP